VKIVGRIILFLAFVVAIDLALGLGLKWGHQQVMTGDTIGRINHALENTDKEILIFGTSRAIYHIQPEILSNKLGLSTYNAGIHGNGIEAARLMQDLMVKKGAHPKIFILQVDPEFAYKTELQRTMIFAPFIDESETVKEILYQVDAFMPIKLASHTYRYNSLALPIINRLLTGGEPLGDGHFKSITKLDKRVENAQSFETPDLPMASIIRQCLIDFIELANSMDAKVIMVTGPIYPPSTKPNSKLRAEFASIANEHGAVFFDIHEKNHPVFQNPKLFSDRRHLNMEGSTILSRLLVQKMVELKLASLAE